jgi:hypothetical protein
MRQKTRQRRILWIESIGFTIIIALSWLTELVRLPHLLYGESFVPNWSRAVLRTVVILAIWVWVYWETKRLLHRLHHLEEFLLICPWCRKIGDRGEWVSTEMYFGTNFATRTTHGMCPECSQKFLERAESKKS